MINLPDVTILAIASIRIPGMIEALLSGCEHINFGAVKLISDKKIENLPDIIQYEECPEIKDIDDYNLYMFKEMGKHVQTSHCLIVQDHARILNPSKWRDSWLEFDWIGAGWPIKNDAYICHDTGEHVRVGNGGFNIRSKRLMEIPNKYGLELKSEQGWANEDGNCTIYHRVRMLELGIKYAPLSEAVHFSFETVIPENIGIKPFGYHRNLPPWNYII